MRPDAVLQGETTLTAEVLFLWLAIALAVLFVGLLVVDQLRRRRRKRRHQRERESSGAKAGPFGLLAFGREVKHLLQERSRRRARANRRRPPGIS
jgi:hypothetical protein